jgi:hypothetical protein
VPATLPSTFNPATYNSTTGTGYTLGAVYDIGDGNLYKFVHVNTAATTAGAVMCVYSSAKGEVIGANRTTALAGTPAAVMPVGIVPGVIGIGNYGFVQVGGYAVIISGTSTLGRWQMPVATNDTAGDATASLARTDGLIGMCIVATAGGFATVKLMGLV